MSAAAERPAPAEQEPSVPAGWRLAYSGKVRDLYVREGALLESAPEMLMVASDRVSAFDHVLEPAIPGKGALLTRLTRWWTERLGLPSQLAPDADARTPEALRDRAMLVRTLDMLPVECVVRGRVTGSGLKEYQRLGSISGVALPEGLEDGDALPEPIYTPAWKAPQGEHDENVSFERTVELVGAADAAAIRDMSLGVYAMGAAIAEEAGLVLADTKFEFGRDRVTGELVLADEVLTPDSSRYWDAEALAAGRVESFDKQIVRDWLAEHWDGEGVPPRLPADVVERTAARYRELLERLTSAA
ncbi:phosphoribosylaminoimidazolesuccinocarboxamide synthase [Agrococcus sp. HG114]|uniref:phosphoribosylaminoimidazolesuccinocarboxamide synthase n=1 Tax=Agrococcus sp. HG114 TaxID=2969757 RepID=UPI00215B0BC9|nr:phosphoribosylaminoimidazolesuccinocarboxamide synthase [Agrococcus sp. HG114]MCR8670618.1 phosphoribosylaminoimidazolesuccinocarboxamide synthase [Agrococcus sp. HG114]